MSSIPNRTQCSRRWIFSSSANLGASHIFIVCLKMIISPWNFLNIVFCWERYMLATVQKPNNYKQHVKSTVLCNVMLSGRSISTFYRNLLPQSSGNMNQLPWWWTLYSITSQTTTNLYSLPWEFQILYTRVYNITQYNSQADWELCW